MKKATIVYIIDAKENTVLMAKKTRKVGVGYYFGYGGKIEEGQTALENIISETKVESGGMKIFAESLEPMALIDFYRGDEKPEFSVFRVLCYRTFTYEGVPISTEEMIDPEWFPIDELPFDSMKKGDDLFVPYIIAGELHKGWIWFSGDETKVLGAEIEPCTLEDLVI